MLKPSFKTWGFVLFYILVITSILYYFFSNYGYDDPYITYRYAQNIINGQGFVYNAAEHVLSTTTPLFTIVLALGGYFWHTLPHLANFIGAFSLAVGAVFIWDLSRTWQTPPVGWVGLLLYPTFPLLLVTIGSETPFYIALILGCFAMYARQRYVWTAVFAGLAVLTRPDGLLVPLLLGMHYLIIERRPVPWPAVFTFTGLVIPWLIFSWFYFGSPVPATLAVKQAQGSMAISQRFAEGFITTFRPYSRQWFYRIGAAYGLLGMIWAGLRAHQWWLFLSWGALYFLAFTLLGVSRYFWYYAPFVPVILVLAGLGVTALVSLIGQRYHRLTAPAPAVLFSSLLVIPLLLGQIQWDTRLPGQISRLKIYSAIGQWLDANLPPESKVGTLEVGIIGYYSHRPMIDFAGLIQPEVARQLQENTTYDDAALWAAKKYRPEFLVIHDGLFPKLEADYIAQNCQLTTTFYGNKYNYQTNLKVYSCK